MNSDRNMQGPMEEQLAQKLIYIAYEGRNFEQKSSRPWLNDNRERLIKTILSISNAGGGYIIIGYDQNLVGEENRRTGVSEEYLDSWDGEKVNRYLNNYCRPAINLQVVRYEDRIEDKKYVILDIPGHGKTPHICIKQHQDSGGKLILKRGAIYYRSKNAACEEISYPDDFEELLNKCLLNRRTELLRAFEQILNAKTEITPISTKAINIYKMMDDIKDETVKLNPLEKSNGLLYMEFISVPNIIELNADFNKTRAALKNASKNYGGWPFIFYLENADCRPRSFDDRMQACNTQPFFDRKVFDYWAFFYKTGIFYSRYLMGETDEGDTMKFHPVYVSHLISEAIIAVGNLYDKLELNLDIDIEIAIKFGPARGLTISGDHKYNVYGSEVFQDKLLTYNMSEKLSVFLNTPEMISAKIIVDLMHKMQYFGTLGIEFFKKSVRDHLDNPKF